MGGCVSVCVVPALCQRMCQWGIQVKPTKDGGVNSQLLCPSESTPTGIHLTVRRSVTPHRKMLMDSPSILPFLLSFYVSPLSPPASVCLPSVPSFQVPRSHVTSRTVWIHPSPTASSLALSLMFGVLGTGVWLSGSARKHRKGDPYLLIQSVHLLLKHKHNNTTVKVIPGAFWAWE